MIRLTLAERPGLAEKESSTDTVSTLSTAGSSSFNSLSSLGLSSSLKLPEQQQTSKRSKCRSLAKKRVKFSPQDQITQVECFKSFEDDHKAQLWYTGSDMQSMRKRQLKELKEAQDQVNLAALDEELPEHEHEAETVERTSDGELTWRGLEDVQQGWCRVAKSSKYTRKVVRSYEAQLEDGDTLEVDDLRKVARSLSKDERARARKVAIQDAMDVGMPFEDTKRNSRRRVSEQPAQDTKSSSGSGMKKSSSFSAMLTLKKSGGSTGLGGEKTASFKGMRRNISGGLNHFMKKSGMSSSSSKTSLRNATFSTSSSSSSKRNATFPVRSSSASALSLR